MNKQLKVEVGFCFAGKLTKFLEDQRFIQKTINISYKMLRIGLLTTFYITITGKNKTMVEAWCSATRDMLDEWSEE